MSLRMIGANPCVTLVDDGAPSAYASLWRIDWSEQGGTGRVIVLAADGRVRVVAADLALARWMVESFNRHLGGQPPGIDWSAPVYTEAEVTFDLDLAVGLRAQGDDVAVSITGPIDRMLTRKEAYDLGGTPHVLSTVWIPCRDAEVSVAGVRLPGRPEVDEDAPMSSAFIAEAEVWGSTTGERGPGSTLPAS